MPLRILGCFFLFIGYLSPTFSQDLSLQVGGINFSKYDNKFQSPYNVYDVVENSTIARKIYAFNTVVDFKKDTSKLYRFKAGYSYTLWNSQSDRQSSNGSHSISSSETFQKSVHFEIALGREVLCKLSNKNFLLKYGLGFPFVYMYQDIQTRWTDVLNNGSDTLLLEKISDFPSTYTMGLNFFSSLQYNFYDKVWFGFELENSLHYMYQKGTTQVTYNEYDPVSKDINSTDIQTEDLKDNGFVTSLLNLSLNLTYRF